MGNKEWIRGANPYMPLWEHVPDGEPRTFTYNGETRVYLYGSHDTLRTEYCGKDYVVWSAPAEDLTDWTCHGVCYEAQNDSPLYAPDVVEKDGVYYMYVAECRGSRIMVAKSDKPWGPFTDPVPTQLGFDPGILVDDDGRVYAYWGFCKSWCAELNDDMATIKEGTVHENPIPHCRAQWAPDDGCVGDDAFFEASSPRKIFGKYVYVYSRRVNRHVPELGIYGDCNGFLSYKWSDRPLDGFRDGGDISFNGGEIIPGPRGFNTMSYRWGNNHGSVMQVNGQWYVFYHRQTGTDEYSRQAMLEPIDAAEGKDGKVYIGKIVYEDGEPVSSGPVEMTSQGAHINGLDARKWISAGYACHLHGGKQNAFIAPVYDQRDDVSAPVKQVSDGLTAGFRYLQFGPNTPKTVTVNLRTDVPVSVSVRIDAYDGKEIARLYMNAGTRTETADLMSAVTGKRAVYFRFIMRQDSENTEFDSFTFD